MRKKRRVCFRRSTPKVVDHNVWGREFLVEIHEHSYNENGTKRSVLLQILYCDLEKWFHILGELAGSVQASLDSQDKELSRQTGAFEAARSAALNPSRQ